MSSWRVTVENYAQHLRHELDRVPEKSRTGADYKVADNSLDRAEKAARRDRGWKGLFKRIPRWISGEDIETAWASLHEAKQALLMIQGDEDVHARLPELKAAVKAKLPPKDERIDRYGEILQKAESAEAIDRAQIRAIQRAADSSGDVAHQKLRSYRNALLGLALLLTGFLIAITVIHERNRDFLAVCGANESVVAPATRAGGAAEGREGATGPAGPATGQPSAEPTEATTRECKAPLDILELQLWGILGGLLSALMSFIRLGGFSGPYGVPMYQAILRIPVGAATGLIGVVLLQSNVLDVLAPQDTEELFAYAIVFGYAQDLLLRLLDRRAKALLIPARAKDDPEQTAVT